MGKTSGFVSYLKRRYEARRTIHRRVPWIGYTLSAVNLVAIAFFVLDRPLGEAVKSLASPLVSIAGQVTDIGRLMWILIGLITVAFTILLLRRRLWRVRRRFRGVYLARMASYLALTILVNSAVSNALKSIIGRARPLIYDQEGVFSFHPFSFDFLHQSFPSAHSSNIGALFVSLALLFPRFRLVFIGLGLWLAATRIIIGVHYPSDVIAGLSLGAWIAFAMAVLFARFGLVFAVGQDGLPRQRLSRIF